MQGRCVPDASLWLLALACGAGTYFFRGLGVLLSGRMHTESALFDWVSCVAYAMIAGLIARIVIEPAGTLAQTLLAERIAGIATAAAVFFLARRHMFLSLCAGTGTLILLNYLRTPA